MANINANPILAETFFSERPTFKTQFGNHNLWPKSIQERNIERVGRWVSSAFTNGGRTCRRRRRPLLCWSAVPAEEVGLSGDSGVGQSSDGYLFSDFGWGVRRMVEVGDEMRRVAEVQAEAFHVPVVLFNDLFLKFFKAEVFSALIYKLRNSPPDRYACLVAESCNAYSSPQEPVQGLVGVVDVTVQRDEDVLRHLEGAEEYLYVSGIAVLTNFRRRKVATVLLKACDVLSLRWGHRYLALRAYEDDFGAIKLYSSAGYRVVSEDPLWITWIGKKRRVIMIKSSVNPRTSYVASLRP